jgi:hypothetical protein
MLSSRMRIMGSLAEDGSGEASSRSQGLNARKTHPTSKCFSNNSYAQGTNSIPADSDMRVDSTTQALKRSQTQKTHSTSRSKF